MGRETHRSVGAVTRFARATGDLHSLSTVDLRLMALARTLEVAAHGDSHLRDLPVRRSARFCGQGRLRTLHSPVPHHGHSDGWS